MVQRSCALHRHPVGIYPTTHFSLSLHIGCPIKQPKGHTPQRHPATAAYVLPLPHSSAVSNLKNIPVRKVFPVCRPVEIPQVFRPCQQTIVVCLSSPFPFVILPVCRQSAHFCYCTLFQSIRAVQAPHAHYDLETPYHA